MPAVYCHYCDIYRFAIDAWPPLIAGQLLLHVVNAVRRRNKCVLPLLAAADKNRLMPRARRSKSGAEMPLRRQHNEKELHCYSRRMVK